MLESIFTVVLVLVALLVFVVVVLDWWRTRRALDILPAPIFLLAVLAFIFDPRLTGFPWVAGLSLILIGVILRVGLKQAARR
jgi:hypothetical protein